MGAARTDQVILDATLSVLADVGLARLSLEEVASRAGVSRQTLYRWFGSREGLVTATVRREEERLLGLVLAETAPHPDLEGALRAALEAVLRWTGGHPLLGPLLASEPEGLLPLLASGDAEVLPSARAAVRGVLGDRLPAGADADAAADLLSRLMLSYAIDPPTADPAAVAADLAALLVRGLGAGG